MGPSGCGKSTLLNALSARRATRRFCCRFCCSHWDALTLPKRARAQGRLASAPGAALGGSVRTAPLGPLAYVAQDQSFFSNMTVLLQSAHVPVLPAAADARSRRAGAQVRETLVLAATLRRGRRLREGGGGAEGDGEGDAAAAAEVEASLRRLGLSECADTLVVRARSAHSTRSRLTSRFAMAMAY